MTWSVAPRLAVLVAIGTRRPDRATHQRASGGPACLWLAAFALALGTSAASAQTGPTLVGGFPSKGPFAVGYRVIDHWDKSRQTTPLRNHEGRPNTSQRATPMQISVWYPARAGGMPMRIGEYHALGAKRQTLGPITEADVAAVSASLAPFDRMTMGADIPTSVVDSVVAARAGAVRDARPADGRFPIVVGGLEGPGSAFGLAEYLASHGYVVATTPSLGATATQQVTKPMIAIETQTRNMEVVLGIALGLPNVDSARVALVGLNFDGFAALSHQMRNMSAEAVVTIDGWEVKSTARMLRASPWYDPTRMRVPYLAFSQDNPPNAGLAFNDSLPRELKYAHRFAYVLKDMNHGQLLRNQLVYPQLSEDRRVAYDFKWRTIRSFLDAYVKGDASARAFLQASAVQNGYPAWVAKVERKDTAFPAIPTSEEVEQLAMSGNIAKLRETSRRARQFDSTATIVTRQALDLYAFRFTQRRDTAAVIALRELAWEVFPRSTSTANNLGNAYRDAGRVPAAIDLFEKAMALIEGDAEIAGPEKDASRNTIQQKIRTLRGASPP